MARQVFKTIGGTTAFEGDVDFSSTTSFVGGNITGVTGFQLTTGAVNNYVLKANGSGTASWQPNNSLVVGSNLIASANDATGLQILDDATPTANTYITIDTQTVDPKIIFGQKVELGANEISGSNVAFSGGTLTGMTSMQLTTGATPNYYIKGDASGNFSWAPVATAVGASGTIQVSNGSGELQVPITTIDASGARILNAATPSASSDVATKQYVDNTALDASGGNGAIQLSNGSGNLTSDAVLTWNSGTATLNATNITATTINATNSIIQNETNINTTQRLITCNDGESGSGVTAGDIAGIIVDRGLATNFQFVFSESGDALKAGLEGALKFVMLREDAPTAGQLMTWNDTNKCLESNDDPTVNSITTDNFTMPTGAVNSYILMSNGGGVGTWQPVPGPAPGTNVVAITNVASGLKIVDNATPTANEYIVFNTLDAGRVIQMKQNVAFAANTVSGSAVSFTGGSITGLSAFQLNTATATGYVLKSNATGNASWGPIATLQETYTGSANAVVNLTNAKGGLELRDALTPIGDELINVTNSTGITSYFSVTPTTTTVAALRIPGGSAGQTLLSDVNGNATWGSYVGSGWQDDGGVVRLATITDTVPIGSATMSGTERFRVLDGAVLFDGTSGPVPTAGAGTRMFWSGAKAALRAGVVTGTQWDSASVGTGSVAFGSDNTASGAYSCAVGGNGTASGMYSHVSGRYARATLSSQHAQAGGRFAAVGDAQRFTITLLRQTTTASGTQLTIDGGAPGALTRLLITDKTSWNVEANITAQRIDVIGERANFKLTFGAERNNGVASTALTSAVLYQKYCAVGVDWDVTVSADTGNGAIVFTVTGEAAKTINWTASVHVVETYVM